MHGLHPATVVTIAACGWILTLALNNPVASASVALIAQPAVLPLPATLP